MKLRFCNISIAAGFWTDALAVERAKGSMIHLERGIALLQVGREADARIALERALHDARAKRGSWVRALHERVATSDDKRVKALWAKVTLNPE